MAANIWEISTEFEFKNHFFNLVDNLILRNIKIRHFSLKQIFATLEPKIQDGRRDWRNLKMVKIKKFFLNLIFRRQILSEDSQNLRSLRRKLWCSRPEFEQYVTVKGSNLMKKGPFSFGTFSYNLWSVKFYFVWGGTLYPWSWLLCPKNWGKAFSISALQTVFVSRNIPPLRYN